MNEVQYPTYEDVLEAYSKTIYHSGGGFSGVRDEGNIKSVLDFVQNDVYYPSFVDKLSFLMSRFCTGHYFSDGNKRIALTLGAYFLYRNSYYWKASTLMKYAEAIIYHLAAGNIDTEFFTEWLRHFMDGTDMTEEMKLQLAKAINKGTLSIDQD